MKVNGAVIIFLQSFFSFDVLQRGDPLVAIVAVVATRKAGESAVFVAIRSVDAAEMRWSG